jgi:hypothetical protein
MNGGRERRDRGGAGTVARAPAAAPCGGVVGLRRHWRRLTGRSRHHYMQDHDQGPR